MQVSFLRNFKSSIADKAQGMIEIILATILIACRLNYSVGINPSQTFLEPVLSESGALLNNWQSEIQPQSFWFLTKIFALLPTNLLTKFTLFGWLVQIIIIVVCFKLILEKFKVNLNLRLAGYILISSTSLSGIGATSGLIGVFYPTNLAFSIVCVLITAVIFQKNTIAGLSAGLVTLCNPSTGLLVFIVFIIPMTLTKLKAHEKIMQTVIPFVLLSIVPIYFAVTRNLQNLNLSNHERINLRLISRMPHHYSYPDFPIHEFISIGFWLIFLFAMQKFMENSYQKRTLKSAVVILIILMAASGFASIVRDWFFLIELRPTRLSPMLPFLGIILLIILSQNLLPRVLNQLFPILISLFGILDFILIHKLLPYTNFLPEAIPSKVILEFVTLILFTFMFKSRSNYYKDHLYKYDFKVVSITLFIMIFSMNFTITSQSFNKPRSSTAMIELYSEINKRTVPGDLLMVPPNLDSIPYFTMRAVIVEWGPNPFGKGEDEYINRLIDVVGSPALFNLANPLSMKTIDTQMLSVYEKNLEHSFKVLCKYNAKYVLSTQPSYSNKFLKPIFTNTGGTILEINAECPAR